MKFVTQQIIIEFFDSLVRNFTGPGSLYLTGESSLVHQRWLRLADRLEYCAEITESGRPAFDQTVQDFVIKKGIAILDESPAEIIPLPDGYQERHIRIDLPQKNGNSMSGLRFFHFDPYSISFRFIARGDETDYKLVLNFLQQGWINLDKMEKLMDELLPAFSFDTIQQDPAEFRRKYKGLLQMWNSMNTSVKTMKE